MRRRPWLVVGIGVVIAIACGSRPPRALAHTGYHHSGGGSSDEVADADCVRWELVPVAGDASVDAMPADAVAADATSDAASDGGGPPDAGPGKQTYRCVEHARLFGCTCDLGAGGVGARPGQP